VKNEVDYAKYKIYLGYTLQIITVFIIKFFDTILIGGLNIQPDQHSSLPFD